MRNELVSLTLLNADTGEALFPAIPWRTKIRSLVYYEPLSADRVATAVRYETGDYYVQENYTGERQGIFELKLPGETEVTSLQKAEGYLFNVYVAQSQPITSAEWFLSIAESVNLPFPHEEYDYGQGSYETGVVEENGVAWSETNDGEAVAQIENITIEEVAGGRAGRALAVVAFPLAILGVSKLLR